MDRNTNYLQRCRNSREIKQKPIEHLYRQPIPEDLPNLPLSISKIFYKQLYG